MPLYPFECRACGHAFEVLALRVTADVREPCPSCGSPKVDRTIGVPARLLAPASRPATNCAGDGPPCGAPGCGRNSLRQQ